jgi:hypothetical protein
MNTNQQLQQAAQMLKSIITEEQMFFAQAVSVCSVVVEMGLQRASLEDVVDGLDQRFNGVMGRDHIQQVADIAIKFGLERGLFETVDSETFSLSCQGAFMGRDWLREIHKAA